MTGAAGFTVSRPRLTNGHFDGVVVVTLSPAYFQNFYERITLSPAHATAALVREDGKISVRYPDIKSVGHLPENSPLLAAARSGAATGVFFGTSSLDRIPKLAAFRRVDNQPLLANFTLADSYYLGQWYTHPWMGSFALLTGRGPDVDNACCAAAGVRSGSAYPASVAGKRAAEGSRKCRPASAAVALMRAWLERAKWNQGPAG